MTKYILDTNIFRRVLDGELDAGVIAERVSLFATHIELNELQNTRDEKLRQQLLDTFEAVGPERIPTASAVWSVSEWGSAEFTSDESHYLAILELLNNKNKGKENNAQDALIADTAISHGLVLVTEDRHLRDVLAEVGGSTADLDEFLSKIDYRR